jgi:acetyl-CoA C-acetyltransferase
MKIPVLGVASTKFGELWDSSLQDLMAQAQLAAVADAGISPRDIQAIFVGNMLAEKFEGQAHLGGMAAQNLNLNVPSIRIECACASGGAALSAGVISILSGLYDVILVIGAEKMTDTPTNAVTSGLMGAALYQTEHFAGATFPGLFALVTRLYIQKYGLTQEQLAAVSIKNHFNATLNPLAQFSKKISMEDVLKSPIVADPLRLIDCSPVSDGACAMIISSYDFAKKLGKAGVNIIGLGVATDTLDLASRDELTSFKATKLAVQRAYKISGIGPKDINIAEVHDAFTMSEIIALEDLGFFQPGTAGFATLDGKTALNGQFPVNTSGGLKAKGHPVGASGLSQAVEIVNQLRGVCGSRQVTDPKIGLSHSMGGVGTTSIIHIFQKD